MKYNKYLSYKDSGIEWLGEIPEHWKILKNRHIFKPKNKVLNDKEDMTVLSLTTNGVKVKKNLSFGKSTESYIGHQMVYPENLVFTPRDFDQTPILSGVSKYKGCISNLYIVLETNSKAYNYFVNYYWWGLKYKVNYFKNFSYGIRFSYNFDQFKEIPFLQSPIQEQQQIADFLDNATAKIDTLIEKQTKLIEILKEKRQAVISHAVTKGVNPNVEMKITDITWLNKIPNHWTEKQFRYATKIYRGKFGHRPRNDPSLYDGIYPFIQTGDVARANKYITKYKQTLNDKGIKVSEKFPKGTLVMAIAANIGDVAILDFEAYAPDSIVGFLPNRDIDLMYLRYSFIGTINILKSTAIQSTQANLNIDRIANVNFLFPPLEEQQQIVNYLDDKTSKMDKLIEKANKSIKLLKEKRTALISAAVTGKIDIRDL